jgi:hypothetical protein
VLQPENALLAAAHLPIQGHVWLLQAESCSRPVMRSNTDIIYQSTACCRRQHTNRAHVIKLYRSCVVGSISNNRRNKPAL